jgi:pilus assembly protein Flp/PilA
MNKLYFAARRFWTEEKGVTAIEYGLIAAIVAVGLILVLGTLSDRLDTIFGNISTALSTAGTTPTTPPTTPQ